MEYPYVWFFKKYRGDRKDHPCKVLARGRGPGPKNIMVEFEDGERVVGIWGCIRIRERPQKTQLTLFSK